MKTLKLLFFLFIISSCDMRSTKDYMLEVQELDDKGRYEEAIAVLDKVLKKDSVYVPAYLNRAAYKSSLGDYKGAIKDNLKVLSFEPAHTRSLLNAGNNYKRLEQYNVAVEYYNKAFESKGGETLQLEISIEQDPQNVVRWEEIYYERGIAYINMDSLRLARQDFSTCLSYNYNIAECYYFIGVIYLEAGYDYKACKYLNRALDLGDKEAAALIEEYCD